MWLAVAYTQTNSQVSRHGLSLLSLNEYNVLLQWLCHVGSTINSAICIGIITTTTPQPFYGPFSGTTRVSRCQKENFWTLWCMGRLIV